MGLRDILYGRPYLSGLVVLLLLSWAYHILFVTASATEPPLIKGYVPFLGAGPQALVHPRRYITQCRSKYGDIFTIYAFGVRFTFVSDPIDGVPAVFRNRKQLTFRSSLRHVFIKVLGFSPERADETIMNKEHMDQISPYLLSRNSLNGLVERFIRSVGGDLLDQITSEGIKERKVVDLANWIGTRIFF